MLHMFSPWYGHQWSSNGHPNDNCPQLQDQQMLQELHEVIKVMLPVGGFSPKMSYAWCVHVAGKHPT